MADHLTMCSEERLVELLRIERDFKALSNFAEARRVQINELLDALKSIANIVPESASEAWMVQTAREAIGE